MTIQAKIIADSVSRENIRVTTMQLRYPRFIHAEFMTHRDFSRNASSSRAIPVERMIKDVIEDTAMPIHWGANQKGMQANEECNAIVLLGEEIADTAIGEFPVSRDNSREEAWFQARDYAVEAAQAFAEAGYHKQIVNRILEPFTHINVLVTSTKWANFLALRDHPAAQPEIRELAKQMRAAMDASTPKYLNPGEWHLPYVSSKDSTEIVAFLRKQGVSPTIDRVQEKQIALSVARCASVSYLTVEGTPMTIERALTIYESLLGAQPIHASPAEHQATPDRLEKLGWVEPHMHGNLTGWVQYRKLLPNENIAA